MTDITPCTTCTRVSDPSNCENKKCVPWRNWFLRQWDKTCRLFSQDHTENLCDGCPWKGPMCQTLCPERFQETKEANG